MRNCYSCKYYKSNPTENECLFTGAYNYPAHSVENCEHYLNIQEIIEEFKEVLQNSNTIKVILTGVGEKQFETKEIFESILELEKLASYQLPRIVKTQQYMPTECPRCRCDFS